MKDDSARIQSLVSERRVKLHVFEPSQRKIWTVVGKNNEHWIDPDGVYCACYGFYFGKLKGKAMCYHLKSAHLARKENRVETIVFSDDEFSNFLSGIISEL